MKNRIALDANAVNHLLAEFVLQHAGRIDRVAYCQDGKEAIELLLNTTLLLLKLIMILSLHQEPIIIELK